MANKGTFQKGDKRAGRKAGSQNKVTKAVKEMIEGALTELGGQKWLVSTARENPAAFMQLLGKIIPKDLNVEVKATLEQLVGASMKDDAK